MSNDLAHFFIICFSEALLRKLIVSIMNIYLKMSYKSYKYGMSGLGHLITPKQELTSGLMRAAVSPAAG